MERSLRPLYLWSMCVQIKGLWCTKNELILSLCLTKHPATAMWEDAGIAWHFLNFYASYGEWSAYRPLPLSCQEKGSWFPLDRRLMWSQSVWPLHTREKSLRQSGIEPLVIQPIYLVTYWLSRTGFRLQQIILLTAQRL